MNNVEIYKAYAIERVNIDGVDYFCAVNNITGDRIEDIEIENDDGKLEFIRLEELAKIKEIIDYKTNKATPMVQAQYDLKARHINKIVFHRAGDFYDLLNDDAVEVAEKFELKTETRGTTPDGKPMTILQIPAASVDSYAETLICNGYRVHVSDKGTLEMGGYDPDNS